jgi:hypothetical protein
MTFSAPPFSPSVLLIAAKSTNVLVLSVYFCVLIFGHELVVYTESPVRVDLSRHIFKMVRVPALRMPTTMIDDIELAELYALLQFKRAPVNVYALAVLRELAVAFAVMPAFPEEAGRGDLEVKLIGEAAIAVEALLDKDKAIRVRKRDYNVRLRQPIVRRIELQEAKEGALEIGSHVVFVDVHAQTLPWSLI